MSSKSTIEHKKSKVTDENKEEARLLKTIWDSREHETQGVFGDMYKIGNQSAVGQFLRGVSPLSLKAAKGFARGLGCKVAEFSPRLAALETTWPFELIDRERYEALSPALQHKAQVRMDDYINELLQEQQGKPAALQPGTANPTVTGVAEQVLAKKLTTESKHFQPGITQGAASDKL